MPDPAQWNVQLDRALVRAIDALYPVDPQTGVRVYNPEGVRATDTNERLERTDDQTDPDRRPHRPRPAEEDGSPHQAAEDHVERMRRSRTARARGGLRTGHGDGQSEDVVVTTRELAEQLNTFAIGLKRISREVTTLRRSVTADAQRLVLLEGAVDAGVRVLRHLQRQIQGPR